MDIVQTDPEVLKQVATVTGIAALISPVVLFIVESVKQAMGNDKMNGILTILVAVLAGLLIGLAIPSIGFASGALAGVFAVAGVTTVRNIGRNAASDITKSIALEGATMDYQPPEPPDNSKLNK